MTKKISGKSKTIIQEYVIMDNDDLDELEELVNSMLQEGYELVGGASVVFIRSEYANKDELKYLQAMIKRTDSSNGH